MDRRGYHISDQYATYFITLTISGWVDIFTRKECRDFIIDSFKYCQLHKGLILNAYVIMSSHIHLIVSAKNKSSGLSSIIRDFKKYTAYNILKWVMCHSKESRSDWLGLVFRYHGKFNKNNEVYKVWQPSNHPKLLLHPRFTRQKLNYIHNNPVEAKIVSLPNHHLYSSAKNYAGETDTLIDVDIIDFGIEEGYMFT